MTPGDRLRLRLTDALTAGALTQEAYDDAITDVAALEVAAAPLTPGDVWFLMGKRAQQRTSMDNIRDVLAVLAPLRADVRL